ncbi:MAG: SMP-30/gluconolactonase/LRE family protein [Acidobacteriota bacterium]|nr:SMP-30/gluconolactonase/LRE family protein [Acidobacteriota bacterium]MDH3786408.1 SMP-30/gluconolactonase/LRE family protein [Acidobacteriota bacterium]
MNKRTWLIVMMGVALLGGCSSSEPEVTLTIEEPLHWTFDPGMIFPADRSLHRAEDGVALPDGRLIVVDQIDGLRLIETDGSSRPFGKLHEAGYRHDPPAFAGGPNGINLTPSGTHVLVSDVFQGGIYRVEISTEATERIHEHEFGVNSTRADSHGGIWFSQSTRNEPENGEANLFRSVAVPVPDGTVFYLPPGGAGEPVVVIDGLHFSNGIALDESAGLLYVSETMRSQVWRVEVDVTTGTVRGKSRFIDVDHPDNLELDHRGQLWIASPIRNEISVFDPITGTTESVFRISTPESEAQLAAIGERQAANASWLDLFTPPLWEPAPGPITGMIVSPNDGPVYATGLGNALIRLDR